jgi:cellulose synthase operon protein C
MTDSMMESCDQLHAYVDGELAADEIEAFEAHLVTCEACNAELPRLLALMAALDAAAAHRAALPLGTQRLAVLPGGLPPAERGSRSGAPELDDAPSRRAAPRRRWVAASLLGLAAAAALLVMLVRPPPTLAPIVASLARDLGPQRALEARLSYPGADRYRALGVARGTRGHEDISMARMAELEAARDWHGLGVAALLAGEPERAARSFEQADASPDSDSDRAALELLDGTPAALERALAAVDRALAAAPNHGPALWNRALVLASMNLPLAAARELDHVVALGEPGWSDEARMRAASLRSVVHDRRVRWAQVEPAGDRLIADGTPVPAELLAVTGTMTITLYDAVRAAPSRERVEALLPMAEALDRAYRSDRLASYVRRIAASDFRIRKPLTEIYRQLCVGPALPDAAVDAFLKRLEQTGTDDIRIGTLVRTRRVARQLEDYRQLASATGDLWFTLIAEQEAARAELAKGKTSAAERRLRDALEQARREHLGYRALQLENELVSLLINRTSLAQADQEAQTAYRGAIASGQVLFETNLLNRLASINADRYALGPTRAYLAEVVEESDDSPTIGPSAFDASHDCAARMYAYESFAYLSLLRFAPDRARDELARVPACSAAPAIRNPLLVRTALVATQLYELTQLDGDRRLARAHLDRLREAHPSAGVEQTLLTYLDASLLLDVDRTAGVPALRIAIANVDHTTNNDDVRVKVRAYGFAHLAMDAGRAHEFGNVIDVMAEALQVARPAQCALAISMQGQQTVFAYADARGNVGGQYLPVRTTPALDAPTIVPASIVDPLRTCPRVSVLARAPVLGTGRLLPPEVAWSYVLKGAVSAPTQAVGRRLIVANPELPPDLKLPSLIPYAADPGDSGAQLLRGAEATLSRVLPAMRDASVIEFHTHGFIANDVSEASYLLLSPDVDQTYALTARDLAQVKLEASPLVILGACHAAASSRSLEGGIGLAEAFLRSGARAVIASPDVVPDLEAREFFTAVRERIAHGADPAIAVRDERTRHITASHDDTWMSSVVVFE